MTLYLRVRTGLISVDSHQPTNPALADIKAGLLQLHRHPGTAVAAKAQAVLLSNMGQNLHVRPRPMADRTRTPGAVAAGADAQNPADRLH